MFYRGVIKSVNPYNYGIIVKTSKGRNYPRYYEWTPSESDIGSYDFVLSVLDDNGKVIGEGKTILNVYNPIKNFKDNSEKKNILCVGDSLTAAGTWVGEGYRRFCLSGGSPEGLGNIDYFNFIGTKSISIDGKKIGYEGTGGWTWKSYLSSDSPFFNNSTGQIDFLNYCLTNGYDKIDEVYFLLTWNGHNIYLNDYPMDQGNISYAKTFISILKEQIPDVKVTCLGIPLCSLKGGMGTNYEANFSYGFPYEMYLTAFSYNEALERLCLSEQYSNFVRYVDTKAQFDCDYNFPTENSQVNTRNSAETEEMHTNGVHPNLSGQLQIGDVFYRSLCSSHHDM